MAVTLTITDSKNQPVNKAGEPEKNELNKNARGGTELMQEELYKRLPKELLEQFQIIPTRARKLEDKKRILWVHDLAQDPEVAHLTEKYDDYEKIVCVSNWQKQEYINHLNLPWENIQVMLNAINPIVPHEKPKDCINIVYFTTPHRGLELLVPTFNHLHDTYFSKMDKPVKLHVFSSFEIYGWAQRDNPYKDMFRYISEHEHMEYYGYVVHEELMEKLKDMHIYAYPCVWKETSCISLMEAMSAGLICVHSDYGALYETAANWTMMYGMHIEANKHAEIFAQNLYNAVNLIDDEAMKTRITLQKQYADAFYNWDTRAMQWKGLLEGML
jgi:glycosyltransferase involved in cell wall biosynthesis